LKFALNPEEVNNVMWPVNIFRSARLSDDLRDSTLSADSFKRLLRTRLFSEY